MPDRHTPRTEIHRPQPGQFRRNRRLRRHGVRHHSQRGHRITRRTTPGTTYATYTWNFGDGTRRSLRLCPRRPDAGLSRNLSPCAEPWLTPCAASTFHSYQYGGVYNVTLTVTDAGGNTASVTKQITVVRPRPRRRSHGSAARPVDRTRYGGSSGSAGLPRHLGLDTRSRHPRPSDPRPGGERRGRVASLRSGEEGPGDRLLGQRAGRRPIPGAARDQRSPSVGLHGAPATDLPAGSARRS